MSISCHSWIQKWVVPERKLNRIDTNTSVVSLRFCATSIRFMYLSRSYLKASIELNSWGSTLSVIDIYNSVISMYVYSISFRLTVPRLYQTVHLFVVCWNFNVEFFFQTLLQEINCKHYEIKIYSNRYVYLNMRVRE